MDHIRYSVAACQTDNSNPIDRRGMRANTDRILSMIDSAVGGAAPFLPVRLVVFPEFAHSAPVFVTAAELNDKLAISTFKAARCWRSTRNGRAMSSTPPA
jgi:predicted amidohydrolase